MLNRFFLICSGADLKLIHECSNGEQNKYAGIGATIFFTALMAFIAGTFAIYTIFKNIYTSLFFGFIWSLLIFNLDRFIVSTMKKKKKFSLEILQVLPRLLLAFIIAIVISKPLELKIFEKEINQVLLTEKNQMTLDNKTQIAEIFTPKIEKNQLEVEKLKSEITNKEKEANKLYETYITEAEGTKGTKRKGKGPVYKEKREKHDTALAQLNELKKTNLEKITLKEKNITDLQQKQQQKEVNTLPIIESFDGLMARINALNKLPWLPSFFIFLLFLVIETAPVFTKLISSKSEYDFKLENQESIIKLWVQQQVDLREKIMQADIHLNATLNDHLKAEEELYTYKQNMASNLIKLQTDTFLKNQQKNL